MGRWVRRDNKKEGFSGNYNIYDFLNNAPSYLYDIEGEAYLAKRPLEPLTVELDSPVGRKYMCFALFRQTNSEKGYEFNHSHFFFDDGSNIGYFGSDNGGELRSDTSDYMSLYKVVRGNLDDKKLLEAIKQTPPHEYSACRFLPRVIRLYTKCVCFLLFVELVETDNCNSWANRVLEKYDSM